MATKPATETIRPRPSYFLRRFSMNTTGNCEIHPSIYCSTQAIVSTGSLSSRTRRPLKSRIASEKTNSSSDERHLHVGSRTKWQQAATTLCSIRGRYVVTPMTTSSQRSERTLLFTPAYADRRLHIRGWTRDQSGRYERRELQAALASVHARRRLCAIQADGPVSVGGLSSRGRRCVGPRGQQLSEHRGNCQVGTASSSNRQAASFSGVRVKF